MMAVALSFGPSTGVGALLLGYVGVGVGVAAWLSRRGEPLGPALSAVALWPLLLPLDGAASPVALARGPLAERIDAVFAALRSALAEGEPAPWGEDVAVLESAVRAADARLARVDRLLASGPVEVGEEVARSAEALRDARARTVEELVGVLAGVERLRLQLGLLALSGELHDAGALLRGLRDRVAALDEVSVTAARG